jgi:hypothetical protein
MLYGHRQRFRDRWPSSKSLADVDDLDEQQRQVLQNVLAGTDPKGLARILAVGLRRGCEYTEVPIEQYFVEPFQCRILTPQQAACVSCCIPTSTLELNEFSSRTRELVADANLLGIGLANDRRARSLATRRVLDVLAIDERLERRRRDIIGIQENLVRKEELHDRFRLDRTVSGLLVPRRRQIEVARSLEAALRAVERDRSAIMQLTAREFETFCADLFRSLDFEVELTKATRDGGADLICIGGLAGVTMRIAVEIKRYKETRPVDVSLVRAFVGANEQFRAEKLVYITTSHYTRPAETYARECVGHRLSLKDYRQIQEWCRASLAGASR